MSVRTYIAVLMLTLFLAIYFLPNLVLSQPAEFTNYVVTISRDGSAKWVIEYRFPLMNATDVEAFKQYMAKLEKEGTAVMSEFTARIKTLVDRASEVTGRSMEAKDFDVSARIDETVTGTFGVIRYEFTWSGFAYVEDSTVKFGDIFDGGFYLSEAESLTVKAGERLSFTSAAPTPDKQSADEVVWIGRRTFPPGMPSGELQVVVTFPLLGLQFQPITYLVLIGVALAVAVAVAALLARRRRGIRIVRGDVNLVIQLIREAGGAMHQSEIVERTGFSKSKVSELLNVMEREGIIERVKMGREKVVVLKR